MRCIRLKHERLIRLVRSQSLKSAEIMTTPRTNSDVINMNYNAYIKSSYFKDSNRSHHLVFLNDNYKIISKNN